MATYRIGVLYGDGIGPEIVQSAVEVLDEAVRKTGLAKFDFVTLPMGWEAIRRHGDPMPQTTKDALKETHGWIMGPHDSVSYPPEFRDRRNPSGELRHCFDLYSNVRPARTIPGVPSVAGEADLVIFRENTEGFYSDRNMYTGSGEWHVSEDIVISSGVFTRKAITRIAHEAFRMARRRRKKVTVVHKANVIRLGSGLFLMVCREVAKEYPDVTVDDCHIDAVTVHLVRRMRDFDVMVTENMFGDILTDLAAELAGSLGMAPSINNNENQAMAQAVHGSAPDIAGKNVANPCGILFSAVMLLNWLADRYNDDSLAELARIMEQGVMKTLEDGVRTRDIGGTATTTAFTKAVRQRIAGA
ncbi:MAG: 3-isopropylmalate dehydrogenase [Paenibacillaceae bacterium ZCTH02-B3]|nr:MAG: 3-isopropylmalate dehydrogenase [Paenibacillaceae bacterium ZCTH02-B3]